jgi:hypothetical protein
MVGVCNSVVTCNYVPKADNKTNIQYKNPSISTPTHEIWCQRWLNWKLHWILIVIKPYYKDGPNDGIPQTMQVMMESE